MIVKAQLSEDPQNLLSITSVYLMNMKQNIVIRYYKTITLVTACNLFLP